MVSRDRRRAGGKTDGTSWRAPLIAGCVQASLTDGQRQWRAAFAGREAALAIMSCRS
jgi:hypothetical protein